MNDLPEPLPKPDQLAPLLQGYTLQKQLGAGGFGVTYLAREDASGAAYVVKHLHFEKVESWKDVELFEREARTLQNLNHPRIPAFKELITQRMGEREELLLIQDYIAGETLEQLVETGKRLSEAEVVQMGLELADVLDYLHGLSPPIIHRDIKPANILHKRSGETFLVDFGAVRDQVKQQRGSTMIGTFGYMAPEQFDGRAYPATDIYALGVSLIFALTHTHPGEMEKENFKLDYRPHGQISHRLSLILDKMTAPNWKERFQSAGELRQAFEDFLAGKKLAFSDADGEKSASQAASSKGLKVLSVVAVALLGLGYLLLRPQAPDSAPSPDSAPPQTIRAPLSQDVPRALQQAKWRGELRWNGELQDQFEPDQVRFWFRNENTHQVISSARGHYYKGHVWFDMLPNRTNAKGQDPQVLIGVSVNANPDGWAGDLEKSQVFNIFPNTPYALNFDLLKVMHLTSPVDNMQGLEQWDSGKNSERLAQHASPVHFAWESMGADVAYTYRVELHSYDGKFHNLGKIFDSSTKKTQLDLALPPTQPGEYYLFKLSAIGEHGKIGYLTTHGAPGRGGKAWDYRFRVK